MDQLFIFEGEGKIRPFNGNYSDYRSWVEEQEELKSRPAPIKEVKEEVQVEKKKLSFKEKQEFEKLQPEIQELEKSKAALAGQLNSGTTDHQELQILAEQIRKIDVAIEAKTLRWLELSELDV